MKDDFLTFLKSLAPLDLNSAGDSAEEIERRAIYDTAAGILAKPETELAKAFPQARHFRLRRESAPELCDFISHKRRLASNATSRAKDVEKSRAYVKRWKAASSEKVKIQNKRWKADNPEKVKGQKERWKAENPDKVKAQKSVYKKLSCDKNYHRAFVAIDSEGMNYPGHDRYGPVEKPGDWSKDFIGPLFQVTYPMHRTFLWGAKGWVRDDPLASGSTNGKDIEASWLIGEEKRALETREILDWLLELPEKYGDVNFVMFSFGYDITQILRGLPQKEAWEILKQEEFEAGADGKRKKLRGPAWWREYSISYIKGKSFTVRRFRDPDNPRQINSKGKLVADYSHVITIYDAFGFYQSPFAKVAQSLVKPGYAVQPDVDVISANKGQRPNFHKLPLEQIKNYCELELTMLSKALTVLRDGFDKMNIHLKSWSGAGSAAGALIVKQKLKDLHFSPDISKGGKTKQTAIAKQQEISHHTFIGGRIELLQQGYALNTTLYGYDIRSAYPSAMRELPSMRGGAWERVKYPDKYQVPQDNILNMYLVTWDFPKSIKSADGKIVPLPFYPCPYRTKRGAILFPSQGKALLMRDDVVAALRWMKCPAFGLQPKDYEFRIDEAWVFTPGNNERPFEFIQNLYDQRARVKQKIDKTGVYDILELAIKLSINSIYGKFAQRIGGSTFSPPSSACPYYASAITAQCRRKVCEAGLNEPFSIVMFATDGIVSTREPKGVGPIGEELGDWETKQIDGGIFLQTGYYSFLKSDGKAETKMRGARKANIYNPAKENMHDLLVGRVLPVWQEGKPAADFFNPAAYPVVDMEQDTYITAGSAVVSPKRWALAGGWAKLNRKTRVHTIGVKRVLDLNRIEYYWSVLNPDGSVTLAQRCSRLVPSVPAPNPTPYTLSAPNKPEWLDEIYCDGEGEENADALQDSAETFYDLREQAEIMMKFE